MIVENASLFGENVHQKPHNTKKCARQPTIGMLLNQGSMTLWKGGEKLGVMQAEGLSGPLCWAVSLLNQGSTRSTRIECAPAPTSPTEEELAAAKKDLSRRDSIAATKRAPQHRRRLTPSALL